MKAALKYILLTVAFAFLASGVVVAALMDAYNTAGYTILWLLLPATLLFMAGVFLNDSVLIPRLLLKNRFGAYAIAIFGCSYLVSLLALVLEYGARRLLGLPMRIADYSSLWILVDAFSNCILLSMVLLGLGMLQLYRRWSAEVRRERELAENLEQYIRTVSSYLRPALILSKLDAVSEAIGQSADLAMERIRELSDYLRRQLTELPAPPAVDPSDAQAERYGRLTAFLIGRRAGWLRHLLFIAVLMAIAFGTFFNAPDQPEFSANRLSGALSMFLLLLLIAYTDILWLYRSFKKKGNLKRYALAVGLFLLALTLPMIFIQIATYEPNAYGNGLPVLIAAIATIGSLLTLMFYVGGISAVLLLQDWMKSRRRMTLLRAETVRQEYACLRKQINPHFLFNILNNIGIIAYDDPAFSGMMLRNLKELLRFQFEDMRRDTTSLGRELSFLEAYFALEQSRRDGLAYSIDCDKTLAGCSIPTLLFIPFVENAVKYCAPAAGAEPDVLVRFSRSAGRLIFYCRNRFEHSLLAATTHGGIGLKNTRRRLDLLFDGAYLLKCVRDDNSFSIELAIPLV